MISLLRLFFPKVLGRLGYTVRTFLFVGVVALLYLVRGITDPKTDMIVLILWNYVAFFVVWPRLRDCGMSAIYVVIALVPLFYPFLALILMFRPPEYEFRRSSTLSGDSDLTNRSSQPLAGKKNYKVEIRK